MLRYVKESSSKPLVGAEIGVYRGINAQQILEDMNIEMLYAIDPWEEYKDGNIIKKTVTKNKIKEAELETLIRLAPFNRVRIIKKHSQDAVEELPDFDFVYIDGAHDFRSVWRDIRLFSGKTYILGGHDYNRKNLGVVLAVTIHYILNIFKIRLHTESNDWWVVPRSREDC
jgi:hypothetical protein